MHTGVNPVKYKKSRFFLFSMLISLIVLNSCDIFFHDMAKLSDLDTSSRQFTVIFNALNDSPNTSIVVEAGSTITKPDDPTAPSLSTGTFEFGGWHRSLNFPDPFYFNDHATPTTVNSNITLYALWRLDGGHDNGKLTVSFDPTEGSNPPGPVYVFRGQSITMPSGPSTAPPGYHFGRWNSRLDGTGTIFAEDSQVPILENTIFYARWVDDSLEYKVILHANNETATLPQTLIGTYNEKVIFPGIGGLTPKENHSFRGWNTQADGQGTDTYTDADDITFGALITAVNREIELYAKWDPLVLYTVTFNYHGGTGSPASEQVAHGKAIAGPVDLDKSGYTFVGWYTSFENNIYSGRRELSTGVEGHLTLHALWYKTGNTSPFDVYDPITLNMVGRGADFTGTSYAAWTSSASYVQTEDIPLPANSGQSNFSPIGRSGYEITQFTGTYDGNNKTISNLTFNTSGSASLGTYIGLFAQIGTGTVKDLKFSNVSITVTNASGLNIGSLAGSSAGNLDNILIESGSINVTPLPSSPIIVNNVGGLVGINSASAASGRSLKNSSVTMATVYGPHNVGGLVGRNNGLIENSSVGNSTSVQNTYSSGTMANNTGGLVGTNEMNGIIRSSYAAAVVSGYDGGNTGYVGGLLGFNSQGSIENSYAIGNVIRGASSGGLVGFSTGTITGSYAAGNVSGTSAGGLVGSLESAASGERISNSYATGSVTGPATGTGNVGGLIGYMATEGYITYTYASGAVTSNSSGTNNAGGLVGNRENGSIQNSVALNPSVNATSSGNGGRIVGYGANILYVPLDWLMDNYGISMTITRSGGVIISVIGGRDGVTTTSQGTANWWTSSGTYALTGPGFNSSDSVWNTSGTMPPKLAWQ